MHKKRIKGRLYFYTSYRDENGKIRTKYLGSNGRAARKREAEFKGIPQVMNWKPFLILFLFIAGIFFVQEYLTPIYLGASIFEDYQISAGPSAEGVNISNATAYFNTSLFGYGNYSDADLDDSNGTSTYKWFVNGILNQTGNTSQLLLCHFNNNYTCEEGETANITQYHVEFNNTLEQINITLNETNSILVYFNVPKTAIITEAYMNISGYLTSAGDELQYDSLANATYGVGGSPPGQNEGGDYGYKMAGVVNLGGEGYGINSWFLINNTPTGYVANMLSIRHGITSGTPSDGNFSYNIKICPTDLASLSSESQTNEPDGNCTSPYIDLIDTVNLSSNFSNINNQWQNFTFNDNTSITFNQDNNYILKFEFVDGDLSTTRYWEMYVYDYEHPNKQTYVAYNDTVAYNSRSGNQNLQFYFKSRYPKGVEIDVGDDGTNDFEDTNESFDTTNTTTDFTSAINTYLSSCSDTYCDIPINVSSNSSGMIGLEALRISYDHYDLDSRFSEGMIANYTFTTKYESDNNIHNHNGTLDIWVKPYWDGDDNNEYTFFTDSNDIIQLNKSSANDLVLFVDSSTVSCEISTWTIRTWYLITATWNEGENIHLYINGSSCNSGSAPATISSLGEFIFIGSNARNESQANATIDELRITGFPRSADEINHYFSESRQFYQNEIFLNSTDTQIKRDDEIIFELTPADITGEVGSSVNSTPLIISNSPPLTPTLNQPANETYISLPYTFSWKNATEYDKEDIIYYVLQIDDSLEFTQPLTYSNDSVYETASPTSDIITNIADGNYSWKVLSSDDTANSSFTETRAVTIDSTAPNLTLTSPVYKFLNVSSSDTEKEVTFYFSISDFNPLTNCTFYLNETAKPTLNQTIDAINQTDSNFTETLAFGGYNWTINCTDIANNINTTEESMIVFVAYSNFEGKGSTTNFSEIDDPTNVTNLTIEEPTYGVINFTGVDLNLAEGIDLDSYVSISFNEIKIDDTGVPALNTSANLTLLNLVTTDSYVLKDGINCTECEVSDSSAATFTFSIESGGTYTTAGVPQPPAPPPVPTGGSGGGGGTRTLTKSRNFDFQLEEMNMDYFAIQMKQGSQRWKKIKITNTGDITLLFELAHNLGEHLVISPEQFRLEPEDTKIVEVAFYADKPGIYTGKIIMTADEIQKIIPITLEVSSEKIVVDAKLDLLPEYLEISQGDSLKAQITLLNTGKTNLPLVIMYLIKDLEGNIVAEEIETFDISDKKSFIKTFDTSNLKAGSYVTGMNVRYGDTFSTSSARFEIKGGPVKKPMFELKWYYMVIIITLFILIMLLKLRSTDFGKIIGRKKRQLDKYEE